MLYTMHNGVCGRGNKAASAEQGIDWLLILLGGIGRVCEMDSKEITRQKEKSYCGGKGKRIKCASSILLCLFS